MAIQFCPAQVNPDSEMIKEFRELWREATERENNYISGKEVALSPMQEMTIDMYCGVNFTEESHPDIVISGTLPAQMELEAIFRARSIALANMMKTYGQA